MIDLRHATLHSHQRLRPIIQAIRGWRAHPILTCAKRIAVSDAWSAPRLVATDVMPSRRTAEPALCARAKHAAPSVSAVSTVTSSHPCLCRPIITPQRSPPPPTLSTIASGFTPAIACSQKEIVEGK
eukprot:scaffold208924_cov30-Tisochrysis_lutea.AAC.2